MADRIIKGDLDKVYDNKNAECKKIAAYILSKGNLDTKSITNKFCNLEILSANKLYYLVITSGRVGGKENNIIVRRYNSETIVKECYLDECKKRISEGYTEVEVVSIYPNCSESTKEFVTKGMITTDKAITIKNKLAVKLGEKTKEENKDKNTINAYVMGLVKSIYIEANNYIKKSLNLASFEKGITPLGVIKHSSIIKGREILKEIANLQNKLENDNINNQEILVDISKLSNLYNSTIPRKLKRNSMDWLIADGEKITEQVELLDVIEMSLSNAVLGSSNDKDLYKKYENLNCEIELEENPIVIRDVKQKMKIEQLNNHKFNTKVVNIYRINQKNAPIFDGKCGNVVSLFHGTKAENLVSILSTSLKLPMNLGPNVKLTGAMFGPGIYFGEFSKALQYATSKFGGPKNKTNRYYMIICDVALGKMEMTLRPKHYTKAPNGTNSVMALGEDAYTKGCYIKGIGDTKDFKIEKSFFINKFGKQRASLIHNEFVIYNQNKFRIKYLVELEDNHR